MGHCHLPQALSPTTVINLDITYHLHRLVQLQLVALFIYLFSLLIHVFLQLLLKLLLERQKRERNYV